MFEQRRAAEGRSRSAYAGWKSWRREQPRGCLWHAGGRCGRRVRLRSTRRRRPGVCVYIFYGESWEAAWDSVRTIYVAIFLCLWIIVCSSLVGFDKIGRLPGARASSSPRTPS